MAERAARLAGALTGLGVGRDDRVGTLMWNTQEHLEAYFAAPAMGALAVPDEKWDERPLACVVLRPDAQASAAELCSFLADKVARWWLPERWAFLAEIPKTSVGKFDKKVLRKSNAEGEIAVERVETGT